MSIARSVSAALLLALATTALGACSAQEGAQPDALTPHQATAEYRAEAAHLTLAPHWRWPATPIESTSPDGSGNVFQPGFGKQAADHYWYCSWSHRAVDPAVTPRQRGAALRQAVRLRTTYYFTEALAEDSRPIMQNTLDTAKLGDLSLLLRDVRLNCPAASEG